VLTERGRRAHLGTPLRCVRCDQLEVPAHFVAYKKTPVFTQDSLPDALRDEHATRPGIWARIHVLEGRLRYQLPALRLNTVLTPEQGGVVPPEIPHRVEPVGAVRFFLELFAAPQS